MNLVATIAPSAPRAAPDPARWLTLRLLVAAALAMLADRLLFDRPLGLSLALFLAILGLCALAANPLRAERRLRIVASALFAVSLAALIEEATALSFCLGLLATALFGALMSARSVGAWGDRLKQAGWMLVCGPFRLIADALRAMRLARRRHKTPALIAAPLAWIMPALLLVLFLYLFAEANPLIESWLLAVNLRALIDLLLGGRPLFWLFVVCAVWPALHVRFARKRATFPPPPPRPGKSLRADRDDLFGETALLRSLVMLNALFALQTSLDLAYLWGGFALPGGMSYAEYAHRGAYPLVLTALIAAAISLFAMRANGPAEQSRLIRPLALAFAGQNILLVASSLLRLDLYVAAYGLTYWRLAAFVWFLLVACGLSLIVAQILLDKPGEWLVRLNLAALTATLYACCFVNVPLVIAQYNVDHSFEVKGSGPRLDLCYLVSLGPQAIPAIDRVGWPDAPYFRHRREAMAQETRDRVADWRSWGVRAQALALYLERRADAPKSEAATSCWNYD